MRSLHIYRPSSSRVGSAALPEALLSNVFLLILLGIDLASRAAFHGNRKSNNRFTIRRISGKLLQK